MQETERQMIQNRMAATIPHIKPDLIYFANYVFILLQSIPNF